MTVENTEEAKAFVKRFLETLEARDLELASTMLAPGAKIIFPGPAHFESLSDVVAWAKDRYQWVQKSFERFDAVTLPEDEIVVYVMGSLKGLNLHGVEFSGVRYVDRFVLKDGVIVSQEVWNDLAESKVLEPA
jgi:hypothetical protein